MAWQAINLLNPPPGNQVSSSQFLVFDRSNGFEEFLVPPTEVNRAPLSLSLLTTASDPQPWGYVEPIIIKPVTGTVQADCTANGCGTGGGGSVRPTTGMLYPRGQG